MKICLYKKFKEFKVKKQKSQEGFRIQAPKLLMIEREWFKLEVATKIFKKSYLMIPMNFQEVLQIIIETKNQRDGWTKENQCKLMNFS